jgi:hypothetical protein
MQYALAPGRSSRCRRTRASILRSKLRKWVRGPLPRPKSGQVAITGLAGPAGPAGLAGPAGHHAPQLSSLQIFLNESASFGRSAAAIIAGPIASAAVDHLMTRSANVTGHHATSANSAVRTHWLLVHYRYATTPHPVAVLAPDQVCERAAQVLDEVVSLLVSAS